MTATNIDYSNTTFVFPTLTKIQGRPTYATLKTIKDELKANATSVTTDLGGGANGHLGLVLTPTEYGNVSAIPYVRPAHPGTLVIPPGSTQHEANRLRDDFKEAVRLYREITQVEKALIKQLGQAMPSDYLKSFRNIHTNTITTPLPTILSHLFTTYGAIEPEELHEIEQNLRAKVFDICEPLVVMFNEVEELQDIATASGTPFSENQKINIGIQCIKNFNDFEKGLSDWFDLPAAGKTWTAFKTHFESARESLRRLRGVTMKNTAFSQQANAITSRILTEIRNDNELMLNEVRSTGTNIMKAMQMYQDCDDANIDKENTENVNSVSNLNLEGLVKAIQSLQNDMKTLQSSKKNSSNNQTKKKRRKPRLDTSKYCWSCGAWNHLGIDCKNKKPGHKDEATFKNRMSGSTECVQIVE